MENGLKRAGRILISFVPSPAEAREGTLYQLLAKLSNASFCLIA